MTRPGPSVTSGADVQPGSDSLFPTGFSGGGALVRQGSVGTGEIADGSVAAADLNLSSVAAALAARGEFTGTYAPWVAARPGGRWVSLGDSLTIGSEDLVNQSKGPAWPVYAAIMSQQRLLCVRNAGIAGNTTAQMLARFDTDVTPYAPNIVTILGGTNDDAGTPLTTTQTNIIAMVAKTRAIGAVPVLCTTPPNSTGIPTNRRSLIVARNTWIRRYAAAQGLTLLDFYAVLVDPATGNYLSAYNNDGTHPNEAGYAAMGALASSVLSPMVPPRQGLLCQDDIEETNAVYKGTFNNTANGSGLPTNWVDGGGVPTGSVMSYTTDAAVLGQMLTITHTAVASGLRIAQYDMNTGQATISGAVSAGATTITLPAGLNPAKLATLYIGTGSTAEIAKPSSVSGSGPYTVTLTHGLAYAHADGEQVIVNGAAGDLMAVSGIITSDGNIAPTVQVSYTGGSVKPYAGLTRAVTRGVFYQEFTLPANNAIMSLKLQFPTGTGAVSFGQVSVKNLTRLGVL